MYIFLIIMNSLIPITMLGFGALWKKYPPQSTNWVYGYRTKMSMKSKETWEFAHAYHAKVWFYSGIILLTISLIVMLLFRKNYEQISTWIIYIQLAVMMLSIIPTEIVLRKRFDKNGTERGSKEIIFKEGTNRIKFLGRKAKGKIDIDIKK